MKKLSELKDEQYVLYGEDIDWGMSVATVKEIKDFPKEYEDKEILIAKPVKFIFDAKRILDDAVETNLCDEGLDVNTEDIFSEEDIEKIQKILNEHPYNYYEGEEEVENDLEELLNE